MGLFSFLKSSEEEQLKCDWCGQKMDAPVYTKCVSDKTFNFCSDSCKKNFRKSGKGSASRSCPACPLRR